MTTRTCPRCDSTRVGKVVDSPVLGKWEVYRCEECNYLWRTTEKLEGITKLTKEMRNGATIYWKRARI